MTIRGHEISLPTGRKVWCGLDQEGKTEATGASGIVIRFSREEWVDGTAPPAKVITTDGITKTFIVISIEAAYGLMACLDAALRDIQESGPATAPASSPNTPVEANKEVC